MHVRIEWERTTPLPYRHRQQNGRLLRASATVERSLPEKRTSGAAVFCAHSFCSFYVAAGPTHNDTMTHVMGRPMILTMPAWPSCGQPVSTSSVESPRCPAVPQLSVVFTGGRNRRTDVSHRDAYNCSSWHFSFVSVLSPRLIVVCTA